MAAVAFIICQIFFLFDKQKKDCFLSLFYAIKSRHKHNNIKTLNRLKP